MLLENLKPGRGPARWSPAPDPGPQPPGFVESSATRLGRGGVSSSGVMPSAQLPKGSSYVHLSLLLRPALLKSSVKVLEKANGTSLSKVSIAFCSVSLFSSPNKPLPQRQQRTVAGIPTQPSHQPLPSPNLHHQTPPFAQPYFTSTCLASCTSLLHRSQHEQLALRSCSEPPSCITKLSTCSCSWQCKRTTSTAKTTTTTTTHQA